MDISTLKDPSENLYQVVFSFDGNVDIYNWRDSKFEFAYTK